MAINVKDLLIENQFQQNINANFRAYAQDLAEFALPRKAWKTSIRIQGERIKFNFLYDSTAIRALRNMASGFYSNLTNPATRWFALETLDKKFMDDLEARQWFKDVEDAKFATLGQSNFYNVIQEVFTDMGGFGPGTFLMLKDAKDKVRYTEIPVEQISRVEDADGRLAAIYRNFKLTARQAVGMWGDQVGKSVMEVLEKKPFTEFDFLHFVGKRHVRDISKADSLNMPFQSVWVAIKDSHLILESGFHEMPYISEVFYHDSRDPNGFSPAMDVFADIKLANAVKRTVIRGGMKQADPPYMMPSRGFILPLNLNPAAMNYRDAKTNRDDIQTLPVGTGRSLLTKEFLEGVKDDIKDGMFSNLFRSLNEITKQMTIPEIQRRVADNMTLLAPVVGRMTHGALTPMLSRLFGMLSRNGDIPPPPEILQDQEFTMVYLSPLAKAQRASEIGDIQSYLADIGGIAELKPAILDKVDEDKVADVLARMRGVTPEIMTDDEQIEQIRRLKAEQDQLIASLQAGQGAAGIAKDGAQANKALAEAAA